MSTHDYPESMRDELELARSRKKTPEQAREFLLSFLEVAAKECGWEVPPLGKDFMRRFRCTFVYKGHELEIAPDIRMQGDEEQFMWEPGLAWRNGDTHVDSVTASYARGEHQHDCPTCECALDCYARGYFTNPAEFAKWLRDLKS